MHEISVARALLRQIEKIAVQNGANRVLVVAVSIGPLSGIDGTLVDRAFKVAGEGTIAEGAKLEIESKAVTVWCASCARETEVLCTLLVCSECGDHRVELRTGNELLLRHVELETYH